MRLSPSFAAVVLLAAIGITAEAGAFTYENQSGDVSGSTPQFVDPNSRGDRTVAPSGSPSISLGERRNRYDPYGYDPTYEPRPLPRGAQIGAGDHGFNNSSRYGVR